MEANLIPRGSPPDRVMRSVPPSEGFSDESAPLLDHHESEDSTSGLTGSQLIGNSISAPDDKYSLVYLVFFLTGMSTLLPWNFFISLNNFWDYKFRDVNETFVSNSNSSQTELQKTFTSYLAIASMIPNAVFVILNASFGQRIKNKTRIMVSLSLVILLFGIVSALAFANSDAWQTLFLYTILCLVVLINSSSAIFQGGTFGMAGKFPLSYIGAQMGGQAMGGIFPALVDIFVVSMNIKEEDVGAACFLIATIVLIFTFLCLTWMFKSPFFLHYNSDSLESISGGSGSGDIGTLSELPKIREVLAKSWIYGLTIFLNFTVTLCIFPAIAVLVQSEAKKSNSEWSAKYFTPVTVFLLFNVGDFLGRYLATWIKLPGRTILGKIVVLSASIFRLAFIPLFMFCNIPTDDGHKILFKSDADFILIMSLFSLSNGYIGSICMLNAPKASTDKNMQEAIASILIACLVVGTGTGSFLSLPIVKSF